MTIPTAAEFSTEELWYLTEQFGDYVTLSFGMTEIWKDSDYPVEYDSYNYSIYLDEEGNYFHIGYNWTKDREYIYPKELGPTLPR